ncbi:MAG: PilZ domain-containing protein [Deltaproteobacteria bacterium]|nr:PilZ domain-containing protein [Deltaproteobacteria bacterium]
MRKRPLSLFICALLFLYFPAELIVRWFQGGNLGLADFLLSVMLPGLLAYGLIRVHRVGWYTLIAMTIMWGVRDLVSYYSSQGASLWPIFTHLIIYAVSLSYFINPRIRHLYFDPKLRWWRTKPRYETHLPIIFRHDSKWHYPVLKNISYGGCFIETPHPIDVDEKLDLVLPLPVPLAVSVFKAQGEVRWVSNNPDLPGMGVQFQGLLGPDRNALYQFLRKQL